MPKRSLACLASALVIPFALCACGQGTRGDAAVPDGATMDVFAADHIVTTDHVMGTDTGSPEPDARNPADAPNATDAANGTDAPDAPDSSPPACGQPGTTLSSTSLTVQFANSIIARWPDPRNLGGSAHVWDYNVGIALRGMAAVYALTGDASYLTYIQTYVDDFVDSTGAISSLPALPAGYDLDTVEPGMMLLFLYQQTGQAKYETAAASLVQMMMGYPRNPDGGFWHKETYPNQMWLDGIYMAEPFLAQYGSMFASCGAFCTTTPPQQIELIAAHVLDSQTGLLYHGWDESMMATWANPTTGVSPSVWGRGLGWYAMALVDILPYVPQGSSDRAQFIQLLQGIAAALRADQDPTTGLWFQVVDMGSRSDDWVETSASGMFVYALKVAVDHCYIDASYLSVAQRGWAGLQTQVTHDNMGPIINRAVEGMGVQDSYAEYVNKPTLSNSGHGLCGILLAGSEMEATP